MSRVQLSSIPIGTIWGRRLDGSVQLMAGATARVYQHGTTNEVKVYAAETGATVVPGGDANGQPLNVDVNGQLPGWCDGPQKIDIVATSGGVSTPAAEYDLIPDETSAFVSLQLGPSNGVDDTATINSALAANAGGTIRGRIGQTYLISGPLVLPSATTLDMSGCAVAFANTSVQTNMLQNAAVAPVATAADAATTAGSSVVTSPTLAAVAVPGQALAVVGAGPPGGNGGGAIWLYGKVLSVAGNNITLTGNKNGVAASATLSGATAYLFNRNSNVKLIGGNWDAGANWNSQAARIAAGFNSHQIRLRRIDGLIVRDVTLSMNQWSGGLGWAFGINPGDVTDFSIKDCIGNKASTVVQGDGPLSRGFISNCRGYTQDDQVAFGCVGFQGNDVEGDIVDVEIDGVQANNSWTAVKLFAGQGGNGAQRVCNATIRSVKGATQQAPVNIVDYAGAGAGPITALLDDITATPGAGFSAIVNTATYGQVAKLSAIQFEPADAGLSLSSIDPAVGTGVFQPGTGFIYLTKLWVPVPVTIANLLLAVSVAGAGLTAGQNLVGLYDSNGNLVALSADQAAAWTTVGLKTIALTPQGSFSLTLPGGPGVFYWVGLLAKGTTTPKFIATTAASITANIGRGSPYIAAVPGAKHRTGYESAGGRSSLISLNGLTVTDNLFFQTLWLAAT